MQGFLDDEEKVLEVLDKLLVNWLVIPSLGVHTDLTVENLEAASEGAGKGPGRVIHFSDQTGADPTRHLDGGDLSRSGWGRWAHLCTSCRY